MKHLRLACSYLISFEFLFVAFLMAGNFKAAPVLSNLPVDLTVFFMATSVIAAAIILYRRLRIKSNNDQEVLENDNPKKKLNWIRKFEIKNLHQENIYAATVFLVFFLWALLTLLYTPSDIYSISKVLRLGALTGVAFMGTVLIISAEKERAKRFLTLLCSFGIIMTIAAFAKYILRGGGLGFVALFSGNYIALGRVAGMTAIIMLVGLIFAKKISHKILLGMGSITALAVVGVSGARGPAVAVALTLILFTLIATIFAKNRVFRRNFLIAIFLVVVTAFVAYNFNLFDTMVGRFNVMLSEPDMGFSAGKRVVLYDQALRTWVDHPIMGVGIGGFPVEHGYGDQRNYPHNLALEVLAELGVVGLILLGLIFYLCLRMIPPLKVLKDHPILLISILLLFFTFLNAMISGDINDNRLLFSFVGLQLVGRCYIFKTMDGTA